MIDKTEIREILRNADECVIKGDYEKALKTLESLEKTASGPDIAEIYERLGNLYNMIERPDSAIEIFNKAVNLGYKKNWAYHGLGDAYRKKNMYDTAINNYENSLKVNSDAKSSLLGIVICMVNKHEYEKAVKKIEDYTNNLSKNADICGFLGDLYYHIERYSDIDGLLNRLAGSNGLNNIFLKYVLDVLYYFKTIKNNERPDEFKVVVLEEYKNINDTKFKDTDKDIKKDALGIVLKLLTEDCYRKAEQLRWDQKWESSVFEYKKALSLDPSYERAKNGFAIAMKTFHQSKKPHYCAVSLALRCTLKCRMCQIWKNKGVEELSLDSWKHIIDDLASFMDDNRTINFAGGEPLLKDGLIELINYSYKKGFKPAICTNAWLIDEEKARQLVDSGIEIIAISLDSLNEKTHDYIRGVEGAYKRVMNAIEYLGRFDKNKRIKIHIQSIISQINLEDLVGLAHWVNRYEIIRDITYLALIQPPGIAADYQDWYRDEQFKALWPEDAKRVIFIMDELLKLRRKDTVKSYKIGNQEFQLGIFKEYFFNPSEFYKRKVECSVGSQVININTNGDIQLCPYLPSTGNVLNQKIEEIWYSGPSASLRNKIKICEKKCHQILNCMKDENAYTF